MRIRKFNEDLESERLDLEFVKECFIELIDKYNAKIEPCEFGEDNEKRGCAITININVNNDITQYYTNCYSLDSVKKMLKGFKIEYAGTGTKVGYQEPENRWVKETGIVKLYLEE